MITNLINNAYDAVKMSQTKWIEVNIEESDNKLIINILDSGPGIDPKIVSKIMDPFFTTKDVGKGTGLGLSISASIIELHGGRLYLDPTSAYTHFKIELPATHYNRSRGSQDQSA